MLLEPVPAPDPARGLRRQAFARRPMTLSEPSALEAAQQALAGQRPVQAAALFERAIAEEPDSLPARMGRARCAMLAGDPALAVAHLEAAVRIEPGNAAVARSLGVALLAAGSLDAAAAALERARTLQPRDPMTRLHLGQLHERRGQPRAAAQAYYRALVSAQAQGLWLDRASTPPHLQRAVLQAMDLVDRERRAALDGVLQPLRERHGTAALGRVERCLQGHLKTLALQPLDEQQRPRFLYFPDLPATRYFERNLFPWIDALEAATVEVRAEAQAVLATEGALQPFLKFDSAEQVDQYLGRGDAPPSWDACFFWRDGVRNDAHHARCPRTSALLESLPLVRIREHAPEICFSVLAPGTHILPHTGVSNLRVVVHLPLIVPADCAIVVGGETHAWREGEAVVFDDTFVHEAWNRGPTRRVILLMDTWNPYLTEVEREALAALVGAIGDFNRE
jgi:aspartate beta-hydroxylase